MLRLGKYACRIAAVVGLAALCGCGGSNGLGQVTGKVTLDGQALPDATITFQPTKTSEETGRPSVATTNAQGEYELMYRPGEPGVEVGTHRVTIETFKMRDDEVIPEKVPPKYNKQTELTREVESKSQTIDFELSSR